MGIQRFVGYPGKDGKGAVVRFDLQTGAMDQDRDVVDGQWAVVTPPATRDGVAYYCRLAAAKFAGRANVPWPSFGEHLDATNPASAAPTLAGDHCIFTLLSGGLGVSPLSSERRRVKNAGHIRPQVIETPSGAVITSSPSVSNGVVYFGSDDGHLYILRSGRNDKTLTVTNRVSKRQSEVKSGETVWTNDLSVKRWHVDTVALGTDYFAINNKYKGGSWRWDAKTGKPVNRDGKPLQIWGPAHACGAIVLTASGHALSATIGGLCMTDVITGKLVWNTPGFGSYTCPHAIATNGRILYAPQTSGMLFCFEPCSENEAHQ